MKRLTRICAVALSVLSVLTACLKIDGDSAKLSCNGANVVLHVVFRSSYTGDTQKGVIVGTVGGVYQQLATTEIKKDGASDIAPTISSVPGEKYDVSAKRQVGKHLGSLDGGPDHWAGTNNCPHSPS